jgi:hypothetical protein
MQIDCYIGRFRPHQQVPEFPFQLDQRLVQDYFAGASKTPAAPNGEIQLQFKTDRIDRDLVENNPQREASTYNLNKALNLLIGNGDEVFPALAPNTIGLLFADQSADDSGLFGLMFNGAFSSDNTVYKSFQRQGAVVFVETIRKKRSLDQFQNQLIYDVIHELGHVFNLWHNGPPTTLMTPSDAVSLYSSPYSFSDDQKSYLSHCSSSDYVRPGGSTFGNRGDLGPSGTSDSEDTPAGATSLRLNIQSSQTRFWHFEPVELDLTISVSPNARANTRVSIPNEIDPGYARFQIRITNPEGHTFCYRPVHWFCHNYRTIQITSANPFHRDITIFGQAGGYTFDRPGPYRIRARLRLGRRVILSNELKVQVLSPNTKLAFYRDAASTYTSPRIAQLLFYREGSTSLSPYSDALRIASRHRSRTASAGLFYALGRNFLRHARQASNTRAARRFHRSALDLLANSLDGDALSGHRRKIALSLIEERASC